MVEYSLDSRLRGNDRRMRLIFVTRKVDRGDPLTGFIFGWLNKLADQLADLYVICQEKGDISGLTKNIEVYSFGKEKGYGRLRQAYQLFLLSYQLSRRADGFFVHMHPIYAIIASLPAKLFGKKIVLWYTHKSVDTKLRVAHALVDSVLTASKDSFRLPSKKVKVVGHGIDIKKFQIPSTKSQTNPNVPNSKFKILSIGRISPIKDYETLIKAVEILVNHRGIKGIEVKIYGKVGLPEHHSYLDSLVEFVKNAELEDSVKFEGELSYDYVDEVYQEADLFVNLSGTGSIDKAVLEAAASGILVASSNEAFQKPLAQICPLFVFQKDNPAQLAEKILQIKTLPLDQKREFGRSLRFWVDNEHNLEILVEKIKQEFAKL